MRCETQYRESCDIINDTERVDRDGVLVVSPGQ